MSITRIPQCPPNTQIEIKTERVREIEKETETERPSQRQTKRECWDRWTLKPTRGVSADPRARFEAASPPGTFLAPTLSQTLATPKQIPATLKLTIHLCQPFCPWSFTLLLNVHRTCKFLSSFFFVTPHPRMFSH